MIADFFRFGWRRRILIHVHGHLPTERMNDWLLDFLYPGDLQVSFGPDTGESRDG